MPDVTTGIQGKDELRSADLMALKLRDPAVAAGIVEDQAKLSALAEASKQKVSAAPMAQAVTVERQVYRMAVLFIGWGSIIAVGSIVLLSGAQMVWGSTAQLPDALVSFASTAIGALAGLLTPLGLRGSDR